MIYVIKSNDKIKFGYAKDFKKRLAMYNIHNPHIEVLKEYEDLGIKIECSLHKRFKHSPVHGKEWYQYYDGILDYIEELINSNPVENEPLKVSKLTHGNVGRKLSDEHKQRMSLSKCKPVVIDGISYNSINEAATILKVNRNTISRYLKRKA